MSKSTGSRRARKPDRPKKPYPDFPLTPHASGKWMKKIRGVIHYFGNWARRENGKLVRVEGDGWKEALELYKAVADDLHAGRTPRVTADGLTIADLCNRFLTAKTRKAEAGELGKQSVADYKTVTDLMVQTFGANRLVDDLAADDFAQLRARMAKQWGPVRLANSITRAKSVFKYGTDNGLVERAVRYGSEFRKPDKAVLRRHRAKAGPRMLEAAEVCRLLDALGGKEVPTGQTTKDGKPATVRLAPNPTLRAMVLLGLNCGFGNTDCAGLPMSAVELEKGWVNFPRPKTGVGRRCPLWPETVAALREAMAGRPEPANYDACGRVFLTRRGTPLTRSDSFRSDQLSRRCIEVLGKLGLHRQGFGFYTLRHVFRTVADEARDTPAVDLIMGHADPSMAGHYRERIDDARLKAVTDHVRAWLFAKPAESGSSTHVS